MNVYMIKNARTGQYWQKGSYSTGRWSSFGTTWSQGKYVRDALAGYSISLETDPIEVVLVETKEIQTWVANKF